MENPSRNQVLKLELEMKLNHLNNLMKEIDKRCREVESFDLLKRETGDEITINQLISESFDEHFIVNNNRVVFTDKAQQLFSKLPADSIDLNNMREAIRGDNHELIKQIANRNESKSFLKEFLKNIQPDVQAFYDKSLTKLYQINLYKV